MNRNSIIPDLIKLAAVTAALPRWTLALLAADGFSIPQSWAWVHAVSAIFGAAMCILEGLAIAYILGAFTLANSKQSKILAGLTALVFASFAGVLSPSIYSRVVGLGVGAILPAWALWFWALCVALTTILTVGAVGYAQAVIMSGGQWRNAAGQWQAKAQDLERQLAAQDEQLRQLATQALPACVNGNVETLPTGISGNAIVPIGKYDNFRLAQLARNGNGPMTAREVVTMFGVPTRTAYNWLAKFAHEKTAA